jgi:hypothetical protein
MKDATLVISALGLLGALPATARAQQTPVPPSTPSSVTVQVTPSADTLHWSFELQNGARAPVEVVADRRLLWFDLVPPAELPPPPGARRRRVRRPAPVRCLAPNRPGSNDTAQHVLLPSGGRYIEGFDLREYCGLRLPAGLVPGATLAVHYGFQGRPSAARAVVLDHAQPPTVELVLAAPLRVPGTAANWPPAPPPAPLGSERAHVTVSGALDGATVMDLRATLRLVSDSPYPQRVFYRPGLFRVEFIDPLGERIECRAGARAYAPERDFFVPLTRRGVGAMLQLGAICPVERFATPGIYRAQAIYETDVSGAAFGFQSFQGRATSPYFFVRIRRGAQTGPYQRLPVEDPFAARAERGDAAAGSP